MEVTTELSRKAIFENARTAQNQSEFNERNNGYLERIRLAHERIEELEKEKRRRRHTARTLGSFIRNLEASPQTLEATSKNLLQWLCEIKFRRPRKTTKPYCRKARRMTKVCGILAA